MPLHKLRTASHSICQPSQKTIFCPFNHLQIFRDFQKLLRNFVITFAMIFSRHPRRAHTLQSLYVLRLSLRSSVSFPSYVLSKARCPRLGVSHLAPFQCRLPFVCFQQLPTIRFCNSLVLITIRIAGRGSTPLPRIASPTEFRIFFQVPYLLSSFFSHSSKNCRGVPCYFSIWDCSREISLRSAMVVFCCLCNNGGRKGTQKRKKERM